MPRISRRSFLQSTGVATAGMMFGACASPGVMGANRDIRLGVVGLNNRGKDVIREFGKIPGVRVTALCDIDSVALAEAVKVQRAQHHWVQTFADYRDLLEKGDIDAVAVVTPNHHHALQAIWACQAGKDVYLEKPVCHNIWEGRKIIEAVAKYDRILQVGSQCRSSASITAAVAWVRAGNLGNIISVRGLCYKRRESIGLTIGPQPIPYSANYDLWLGPAPVAPLRRKKLHYDWHWQFPYGNGDLGNQGVHQMDIARWFLGEPAIAPRILSVGGRLGYHDDADTPNTLTVVHDYPAAPLIFEVRGLPEKSGAKTMDKIHDASIGVIVECAGGRIVVPSYIEAHAMDQSGKVIKDWKDHPQAPNHEFNFITAVRSRIAGDLHAPIAEGYVSSALCHTANISYRLGKNQSPDAIREQIHANSAMSESFARMVEHLGANGVDFAKTPVTLGAALEFDPKTEKFTGSDAANALLTRDYRKPFVVPDKI